MVKGLGDEWFADKFCTIEKRLGEIDAKLSERLASDKDHERRIRALEKIRNNGRLKTAGLSAGAGGVIAALITIIIALIRWAGGM